MFDPNILKRGLEAPLTMNLPDTREKLEAWRKDYNEVRPHSSIGNKSPIMLINHSGEPSPLDVMPPENSSSD